MSWNLNRNLSIAERYKALLWNYSDDEIKAMREKANEPIDFEKIKVWTILELRSREDFVLESLSDWHKLWWKQVIVTEIISVEESLKLFDMELNEKYLVDGLDQNLKKKDIVKWVWITNDHIKSIISLTPYNDLGKWFYEYKWKTYFYPKLDSNKDFNENNFLKDSKIVDIIDDNTVEIDKKKFKKKHIGLK